MPRTGKGLQLITFAIESDEDQSLDRWVYVNVKKGDTIAKIAARNGHPEAARQIADRNGVRSVNSVFTGKGKKKLLVPGKLAPSLSFDVMAGDAAPHIVGGYAKLSTLDRPERVGLTVFDGYDPVKMEVPIRFEAENRQGVAIEDDIALLERMAGRGDFQGTAIGPPPVVHVSTTGPSGEVVPLIPRNYQWSPQNRTGPLWRIADIDWDANPIRNVGGNRIRQLATVTVQQHTPLSLVSRSVTVRARSKPKKTAKK
jgi:hypothetical protein